MWGNGNVVGKVNTPSISQAGGMWSLREQHIARTNSSWPRGAPAFDSVSGAATTNTTSLSWTHTPVIPASCVIVMSSSGLMGTQISSATYGGQSMTRIGSAVLHNNQTGGGYTEMFRILNPPTGAQTVSLTLSGSHGLTARSIAFTGVSSIGTVTSAFAPYNVSVSATAAVGSLIAHVAGWTNGNSVANALTAYGQTQRFYDRVRPVQNGIGIVGGTAAGTGSSVNFTTGIGNWCSGIAVVLNP